MGRSLSFKGSVLKKILSTKIQERKCQYTGINLSKMSAPLSFLDTKLITFVRT